MYLKIDRLADHLQKKLAPLYLISGNEPLLSMEAADQIRQAAAQAGFSERDVYHVAAGFDWNAVSQSLNSMSLFASKKLLEIRLPTGKAGATGGALLAKLAERLPADTLVMLIVGKPDSGTRKTKWYKAMESRGVCLQLSPVSARQLPAWIERRLLAAGISASSEAVYLLADRVEGNLLAADQEVKKLKMLISKTSIEVDDVLGAVTDSATHSVFELVDAALARQTHKLSRMLGHIRGEGVQPTVVLWSMAREFRLLFSVADALRCKRSPKQVMDTQRVWESRRSRLTSVARRKHRDYWGACLASCARVDRIIKGREDGNPWDELLQLSFRMSQ